LKAPAEMLGELLGVIEQGWYAGQRDVFFRDRADLVKWLTYPAWFLENRLGERYAALPWERYRAIVLEGILLPMKAHGREVPRYFPAYLGRAVQEHMRKHWEDYADEVRGVRGLLERQMARASEAVEAPSMDRTVERLGEVHRAMQVRGGRKKKGAAIQPELF
jgi:hypothetical protein